MLAANMASPARSTCSSERSPLRGGGADGKAPSGEVGSFEFENEYFHYIGETRNGAPHGVGILCFYDGGSVEGNFHSGEIYGVGTRRWADGTTYVGEFVKGEQCGVGRYVSITGDEYEGEFRGNQRCGKGVLTNRITHVRYEGTFLNHKFDGAGRLETPEVICDGHFAAGLMHGPVVCHYANGDRFTGEAVRGVLRSAHCFVSSQSGMCYCGPFDTNGKRQELPNAVAVESITLSGRSIGGQLHTADRFATTFHCVPFQVSVRLGRSASGANGVVITPVVAAPSAARRKGASSPMPKSSFEPQNSESGRDVRAEAIRMPAGGLVTPEEVVAAFRTPDRVSFAAKGVLPSDIAAALATHSSVVTLQTTAKPIKAVVKTKKDATGPHSAASASGVPPASANEGVPQDPFARLPSSKSLATKFRDGVAVFDLHLLTVDPGDFVVRFIVDTASGAALAPGKSEAAPLGQIECALFLHVVRQC